jgi:hypothetical protein
MQGLWQLNHNMLHLIDIMFLFICLLEQRYHLLYFNVIINIKHNRLSLKILHCILCSSFILFWLFLVKNIVRVNTSKSDWNNTNKQKQAWWYMCYPSIQEAEDGGLRIWGQSGLHSKFQIILSYISKFQATLSYPVSKFKKK